VTSATGQTGARLADSGSRCFDQAGERGRQAGAAWAEESAEYLDLKRLVAIAAHHGFDGDLAGYRVVSTILGERHLTRQELAAFRETFGLAHDDADTQNREYWRGFVQSALDAYDEFAI
jgi:hypothetical protein